MAFSCEAKQVHIEYYQDSIKIRKKKTKNKKLFL